MIPSEEEMARASWHAELETALMLHVAARATADGWEPHWDTLRAAADSFDQILTVLETALAEAIHPRAALHQWLALETLASLAEEEA